jgi:RNA polymerase sigma-70 factor (ECF subfamily)
MAMMPDDFATVPLGSSRDSADDAALMGAVARGDRDALSTLVRRHQQRVWNVAYRFCGRAEDADDLTQEAFLRLWRGASTYRPTAQLTTWLYRIVVNLWVDLQRRRAHAPLPLPPDTSSPVHLDPAVLESAETAQRVQNAIAKLAERQRAVLVLHRYEGLSLHDIHEATGWSTAAIESLLSRAYAALRESLRDLAENSGGIDRRLPAARPFNAQESV